MTRQRKTQTALSKSERLVNTQSLFALRKTIDLNGKGVLLVDDICTTGATLSAAAQTLSQTFKKMHLYLFSLAVTF